MTIARRSGGRLKIQLRSLFKYHFNLEKKTLEDHGWNQLTEYSFDSFIKRMLIVDRSSTGQSHAFIKRVVE